MESSKFVHEMNEDKFNTSYHEWSEHHIPTCKVKPSKAMEKGEFIFLTKDIPASFDLAVDPQVKQSYEGILYDDEGFGLPYFDNTPCKIVKISKDTGEFDVVFFFDPSIVPKEMLKVKDSHILVRLNNLPAEFIVFRNLPFKSDMLAPNIFRHEIAIPDESFPPLWKDLE